jgi:PAS domain S-box-containing protein
MRDAVAIVEGLLEAIVVIDRDGTIELVNKATETLFGYDRSELVGQSLGMLLPERTRERHKKYMEIFFA